jgi:hypothetical protein
MNLVKLKYFTLTLVLVTGSVHAYSQRKSVDNLTYFDDRPIHFGFYLGLNTMDYRITNYKNVNDNPVLADNPDIAATTTKLYGGKTSIAAEVFTISPGFTVGGVVNYRLSRDFDLRFTPGMSIGSRIFKYYVVIEPKIYTDLDIDRDTYLTTNSSYVDIPVGIRYKGFRDHNVRPYIYLGAAYRQDLDNKTKDQRVVRLKKNDVYGEVGMGLDSYLEYFRFTAEFRFSYGVSNLIKHDTENPIPYYGFIFKELNSNIFSLIFYFE